MVILGGRYESLILLGEGGAALVYLARDNLLEREVALKLARDGRGADTELLQRFRNEAKAAASLAHPNVVAVYDYGEESVDGVIRPYLVMELMRGPTLKELIERGNQRKRAGEPAIPIGQEIVIARAILSALAAAHSRGIVHRDIKPQNVLFALDGTPKVADFGIARAMSNPSLTAAGETVGTSYYLSPEQARGGKVGPASDIYSTGVVLFEMLAGRVLFEGETGIEIAMHHVTTRPTSPREFVPDLPLGLERAILRALAKDPAERFPSAVSFSSVLRAYADDDTESAVPLASYGFTAPAITSGPDQNTTFFDNQSDSTTKKIDTTLNRPGSRDATVTGRPTEKDSAARDEGIRSRERPSERTQKGDSYSPGRRLGERYLSNYDAPPARAPQGHRPPGPRDDDEYDYPEEQPSRAVWSEGRSRSAKSSRPFFVSLFILLIAGFVVALSLGAYLIATNRPFLFSLLDTLDFWLYRLNHLF